MFDKQMRSDGTVQTQSHFFFTTQSESDSRMKDTLYIVMPAYNEEERIRATIAEWYPKLSLGSEASRLVVADSGSHDNTHRILKELQETHPRLLILEHARREHGPKLIALYRYAVEAGADYVFQTDSDGQTDPKEFDAFWQERKRYAAILGSRSHRRDGWERKMAERVVCMLLFFYFGVRVPDANAPFRLMKAERLHEYLSWFEDGYPLPNIMLTALFARYRERLAFREITFRERQGGKSSVNLVKMIRIGRRALRDFARYRRRMRRV